MKEVIKSYRNAHYWLIIPLVVIGIGFGSSYFATFSTEPWGHHLHALSAIAWYLLIVIQPYLIQKGNYKKHRLYGMIGLFIAGAVVFSALSITPSNVYYAQKGGFPPFFPEDFFYGIIFTETFAILGFSFAVIMAIIKAKNYQEHAIWMISTVFFGLMPAWGRATMAPVFIFELEYGQSVVMKVAVPVFLIVLGVVAYRLKKLRHPAILLAALVNLTMLFIEPIGGMSRYQELITKIMKPVVPW